MTRTRIVLALAAVKLAVHLATLAPYGWFRDELYYVACSRHLGWGYVDHPPFSIAVVKVWQAIFGESLVALRVVPALLGAWVVAGTGLIAIELGAKRVGAFAAAIAALCAPAFLGFHHYYSMNAIDHAIWTAAALLALRAVRASLAAEPVAGRRWVWLGFVLGAGVLNKWSVLWLGFGLLVALVATDARRTLKTKWPWIAGGIAALLAAPHFIWEVRNGWPTLEFIENAMRHKYVALPLSDFFAEQLKMMNPAAAPLVLAGVVAPFLRGGSRPARLLVVIALVAQVVVLASRSGKPEYLLASYPLLFASGARAVDDLVARGPGWVRALASIDATAALVVAAMAAPFALACLPVDTFVAYSKALGMKPSTSEKKELRDLPQFYADMFGWEKLVSAVAAAWDTLAPDEKRGAAILVLEGGYGPAAAIDVLGSKRGLPNAIGGHNSYWLWGYGDADGRVLVLVGGSKEDLAEHFESLEEVSRVECARCMPYEDHKPIYVGRGLKEPMSQVWPRLKHYE